MKLISVVTGCYNEEDNVEILHERVKKIFDQLPNYRYELIFIDNASTDSTVAKLKRLAATDKSLKIIVNRRNFGHVRSPYHAFLQARGDAVIAMASDLQDPPELIPKLIEQWENGHELVVCIKTSSKENPITYFLRTLYYKTLNAMAGVSLIEHFTGFGLYDQVVVSELRRLNDTYPYVRGLISELGFRPTIVPFDQPQRLHGKTHNNLFSLYDVAMLGLTTHSVVPMRMATVTGLFIAAGSALVALFYLVYKLVFWSSFEVGMAPLVIGMFAMFSVELIFIGLLGEYVGASHRQLLHHPLVIEKERINFENDSET